MSDILRIQTANIVSSGNLHLKRLVRDGSDNDPIGASMRVMLSDLRYGRDQSDNAPTGRIQTYKADNHWALKADRLLPRSR